MTNALAKRLEVTVWRDGQVATIAFAGGDVVEPLAVRKAAAGDRKQRHDGARLARPQVLRERRAAARRADAPAAQQGGADARRDGHADDREDGKDTQTWLYKGGLRDYLMQSARRRDAVIPLFEGAHYADGSETENFAEGEGAAWCVAFTEDGSAVRESYVNLIPTVAGGTHEAGLRTACSTRCKGFIDLHACCPRASS